MIGVLEHDKWHWDMAGEVRGSKAQGRMPALASIGAAWQAISVQTPQRWPDMLARQQQQQQQATQPPHLLQQLAHNHVALQARVVGNGLGGAADGALNDLHAHLCRKGGGQEGSKGG